MFEKRKLLVVEDDKQEIENISRILKALGVEFVLATKIQEAVDALEKQSFHYLLSDLHIETKAGFERPDGLLVIKAASEQQPGIIIVANSSDPRAEIWSEALAAGAQHFIRKPVSKPDELVIAFGLARERKVLLSESNRKSKSKVTGRWKKYADGYPYGIVIGERELRRTKGVARSKNASIVLTGETGTGKEEIAKLIHRFRVESEGPIPFVAVNCATIAGTLADSLLFGHKKGSFTGAEKTTDGYIGGADGGILFLDEIQTLEIQTQQKLLRVLNDGSYYRVGEVIPSRSQFQLIAATTKNLDAEVEAGRFLIDIHMRMTGLDLELPPLRERAGDIPALVALFLSKKGIDIPDSVFDELVTKLKTYRWSGNIRQLFKALESWILTCEFDEVPLTVENFPIIKGMKAPGVDDAVFTSTGPFDANKSLREDINFDLAMAEFEKAFLVEALKRHRVIGECCQALGMARSTLDAKRKKYGIS